MTIVDFDPAPPQSIGRNVSRYFPLMKNYPTCQHEEDLIRKKRVALFIQRHEAGLDIWTGNPLPPEVQITSHRETKMNAILVIHPYKYHNTWVFDDESVGLQREPFVAGADVMIDKAVEIFKIKKPDNGFTMLFSATRFPTFNIQLNWVCAKDGGNIYSWKHHNLEGWLCPALLKYFPKAPQNIFVEIRQ